MADPLPPDLLPVLPATAAVNAAGHLEVGGCDTVALAAEFGTPLFVYDEDDLRGRCREFREAFGAQAVPGRVAYAGKAFGCLAMLRLVAEEDLWLDVSTGGELAVALQGGLPPERILLHGNNKSEAELAAALDAGVARIVIDSEADVDVVDRLVVARGGRPADVHLRLTPGIDADTHEYIRTGQEDSKFGLGLRSGQALSAAKRIGGLDTIVLRGVHCHIGSQIFDLAGFREAAEAVMDFIAAAGPLCGSPLHEVNLGGGLGIAYTAGEVATPPAEWAALLSGAVAERAASAGVADPVLFVEPGRAIAGRAGLTLYTVGAIKHVPGVRTYVAVDGGMSDNLRTALYGARYEALLADRPGATRTLAATVAGKHCESGDVVIEDALLPADVVSGDVLVTPATGAYGYAMANNYNLVGRPAVVFVRDGAARVAIRREEIADLTRLMR